MPSTFRLSTRVCQERFDTEALLLIVPRQRLLTVNLAAADLYDAVARRFGTGTFGLADAVAWLEGEYVLESAACRSKARELLAFGLKHGLVLRATGAEQ